LPTEPCLHVRSKTARWEVWLETCRRRRQHILPMPSRCSDISLASKGDSLHGVVAGSLASCTPWNFGFCRFQLG